jgi:betaine-aldehyde dehydrogenase
MTRGLIFWDSFAAIHCRCSVKRSVLTLPRSGAGCAGKGFHHEGTWAHDPQLRSRALIELADRLSERADAIGLMLSREMGKVLRDATLEATLSPGTLRYNAGTALSQTGTSAEVAPGLFASAMREPIGVAGIIVPWNSPLALLIRALGPALAAGCTTVIKLPGQTALVNSLIMEAVAATKSLPNGVVNIFTEAGNEGAPLIMNRPRSTPSTTPAARRWGSRSPRRARQR